MSLSLLWLFYPEIIHQLSLNYSKDGVVKEAVCCKLSGKIGDIINDIIEDINYRNRF
jgi:hypothetical protein